ncbi:maleylpyruvate isomerase N-terminal domain-containing protein [Streptomyces litchfieldiae]|uniref:Maleylpyruvate isomerase N-terminal domain-containing protein n=1 Tax=Streptomyces litchfieldiae TaxID=3075543 RepID=A0ABU2MZW5_9ACTN|nr:maleylpyruvate isomerase N-terminal domain-containing protein [Streptomyces sp. DSM 44938]MDT0347056.1 maleylpyruvate isomerase N-terminal domain-containing protein [Streptomyces sp. DSM 44938]
MCGARPRRAGTPACPHRSGSGSQTGAFAGAVAGPARDTHVPTCPEWRLRGLVGHIGQAHRWAAEIVRTGEPDAIPDPRDAELVSGTEFRVAPELAADAISESRERLSTPGPETLKPHLARVRGHGETLQFGPREESQAGWLITRTPRGTTRERRTGGADVVVRGTERELLLLVTRRLPADGPGPTVGGDHALLDHWLANTAL